MKKTTSTLAFILFTLLVSAQNLITIQRAGTPIFYSSLQDVANNCMDGDSIYLPGGIYNTPSVWTINKKLHIYGVGHYPDSTAATSITKYIGTMKFIAGSDSSLVSGIYIHGNIYVGTNSGNQAIDGLTISRCYLTSTIYLSYDGYTTTAGRNFHIEENVLYNIQCGNATNVYIERNIFYNTYIYYLNGSGINTIRNNIFLYNGNPFYTISNTNIENNIFLSTSSSVSGLTSCTLKNNLFVYNVTDYGTNTASGNYVNQAQSTIFENQSGNSFSYAHDYKLKVGCPGISGGTDGTDVGIFGTTTPYKEGAVPVTPHIREQTISTVTDGSGNINVSIKIGAQDR